ncbi:hypothetical protein BFP97_15455 [Roseivirga sp. 4D4]|uniref:hypothetical protein n=1 Tax=Roseivirga sp. 4D4 TaxID=1889784 RepID=UPI000853E36A|nr:hypothetical protein [Roseivirga sp. 4D4]OEK02832.1 hypothetical protein BFP97_15455 [Roseivirga sp. 4D4]
MKRLPITLITLAFVLAASCSSQLEGETDESNAYFDLGGLLDKEIDNLTNQGATLEKVLQTNGQEERLTLSPDSAGWHGQLMLFYEADINKPGFIGEYFQEELPSINGVSKVIYTSKSQRNPVQVMECFYENDFMTKIRLLVKEINTIYSVEKELSLYFDQNGLSSFDIKGEETMRLKKDLNYQIQGAIVRSL